MIESRFEYAARSLINGAIGRWYRTYAKAAESAATEYAAAEVVRRTVMTSGPERCPDPQERAPDVRVCV